MVVLALESLFTGFSIQAVTPDKVILWQRWRWGAAALLPGSWLLFSLSFPRADFRSTLAKWKWVVLATFLVHLSLVTIFASNFLREVPLFHSSHGWLLNLGWSGYVFHVCFLVSAVVVMMLLEKTLRASRGRQRWQVKFLSLGIGAFFAARVYTASQVLLFHRLNLELEVINATALLVADLLILISIFRAYILQMDIYLSRTTLYYSFTLLMVGVYLLTVAVLAKAAGHVHGGIFLPSFFVFSALVALSVVLFSDRLRLKLKQLISRHFGRPQYDYREAWMAFTQRTATLVEEKPLCNRVVEMISDMFDTLSVSLWLLDKKRDGLRFGGSTVFSETQAGNLLRLPNGTADLVQFMRNQKTSVDLEAAEAAGTIEFNRSHPGFFQEARIRYCIPLKADGNLLGLISLDDRVKGKPFSFEELDMLGTIADQVAASLLNLALSEQLQQAREMEAFQAMAAFFVHDLKNLASKLSLLLQNMSIHFDNPDFRQDALRSMSRSVEKINSMCSHLSLVRNRLEIQPVKTDLNEVAGTTLADLRDLIKGSLVENLQPVPKIFADSEQIRKVLTNLVLNANEATENSGEIRVTTGIRNGCVALTVSDDGCGMSEEFMNQSLFRPFKTTKKQGTGIGLFQSKMIVDAHNGQMEVESREGKGSTFRVLLPVRGE